MIRCFYILVLLVSFFVIPSLTMAQEGISVEVQPQAEQKIESQERFKSLMFDNIAINQFIQVYEAFQLKKRNTSLANANAGDQDLGFLSDILGELEDGLKKQVEEVVVDTSDRFYPVIHLSSILYTNDDSWSVWINGKKVTNANNGKTLKSIKVKDINREKVVVQWKPWNRDQVADSWKKAKKKPKGVKYNSKTGSYTIPLKQNQSFRTADMRIIDGIKFGKVVKSNAPDIIPEVVTKATRTVRTYIPQGRSIEELIAGSGLSPKKRAIQALDLE